MCRLIQGWADALGSGCVLLGAMVARSGIGDGESRGSARSRGGIERAADALAAAIEDGRVDRSGSAVALEPLLRTSRLSKRAVSRVAARLKALFESWNDRAIARWYGSTPAPRLGLSDSPSLSVTKSRPAKRPRR